MSAVSQCILDAVEAGLVNDQKGREIANLLEEAERQRIQAGDPGSVAEVAPQVLRALVRRAQRRRKNIAVQTMVQQRMEELLAGAPARGKATGVFNWMGQKVGAQDDVIQRAKSIIAPNFTGGFGAFNLQRAVDVHRGRMHGLMTEFIEQFRSKAGGFTRDKAGLRDVIRELYGQDTGNVAAKDFAKGVRGALDYELATKRRYGSEVSELSNYVPQRHDPLAVRQVGEDAWVGFIAARLDRARMVDDVTGLPLDDAQLDVVLRQAYKDITTANAQRIRPDGFVQTSLLKRLERERRLHFRSADDWMEYNERFGTGGGDLWNLLTGHFDAAARDIAQLQVFGPMPSASLRFLEKLVEKRMREADPEFRMGSDIRDLYDTVTGAVNVEQGGAFQRGVARTSAANRSVVLGAVLGGAFLTALTDVGFAKTAARMSGLPYSRVLRRQLGLLNPANGADRRSAVRAGFTAQGWVSRAAAAQRIVGEVVGPEWSRRVLDTVLRISLLSPWTDAGRWAFGMEFAGFLTEHAGRSFDELPDALRSSLARHGIAPEEWDAYRATPLFRDPETGAEFIRAEDVADVDVADKFQAMMFTEIDAAIPQSTAATRARIIGGSAPGSLVGEVMRNVSLLKSFPVSVMHIQLQRIAGQQGGLNRAKYVAHLMIATTMMAMLSEQASRVSRGQELSDMDDVEFWEDVMWRSGAFGLLTDWMFTDVNRTQGFATALMGPIAQELNAAQALTIDNIQDAVKGERLNLGRDVRRFMELTLPGNRLWYARLAFERLFFDEMQKLTDPRAAESFRAVVRSAEERGEAFFAPPGQGLF